jgi:hypothetical protein
MRAVSLDPVHADRTFVLGRLNIELAISTDPSGAVQPEMRVLMGLIKYDSPRFQIRIEPDEPAVETGFRSIKERVARRERNSLIPGGGVRGI